MCVAERERERHSQLKSAGGHLTTVDKQFREARDAAGLPKNLVPLLGGMLLEFAYCKRREPRGCHEGHGPFRSEDCIHYWHPDLEIFWNGTGTARVSARECSREIYGTFCGTITGE